MVETRQRHDHVTFGPCEHSVTAGLRARGHQVSTTSTRSKPSLDLARIAFPPPIDERAGQRLKIFKVARNGKIYIVGETFLVFDEGLVRDGADDDRLGLETRAGIEKRSKVVDLLFGN